MKYDMTDVRKELYNFKKFLDNEPYEYMGIKANLRKAGILLGHMLDRVKESIECDGEVKGEYNLNIYALSHPNKATEKVQ